jgi:predicted nucleotidyltransferase
MEESFLDPAAAAAILRRQLSERAEEQEIVAAWLFGSVARGAARRDSDVDVGILFREAPARTLAGVGRVYRLEEDLAEATGLPVQIVSLHRAPVDLIVRVLREGKLLVDREPLRRIGFEVAARKELWDLEPYLRLYRGQAAARS